MPFFIVLLTPISTRQLDSSVSYIPRDFSYSYHAIYSEKANLFSEWMTKKSKYFIEIYKQIIHWSGNGLEGQEQRVQ